MSAESIDTSLIRIRRRSQWLGLGIVLCLVGGWWYGLLSPLNRAADALEQRRLEVESLHSQHKVLLATLETARATAAQWQERKNQLQQRTRPTHDDIDFLEWAHEQAAQVDLDLIDFRPSGKESLEIFEGRGLMLSANGSFDSICRFLNQLRHCPRMNRITSLEITPAGSDRQQYSLVLRIVLFTLPSPQA
jgi:Tfp pilus assembly protein PilO